MSAAELATGLPVTVHGVANEADEAWERDGLGEFDEGPLVVLDEGWALDEILRRVAADAEFREDGDVGAGGVSLAGHGEDAGGVAVEVADGGVELGEGDFHGEAKAARTKKGLSGVES